MRFLVVDLEATCWQEDSDLSRMEIIEIGAVMLASKTGPVGSEFDSFVRPTKQPLLSDFCRIVSISGPLTLLSCVCYVRSRMLAGGN